MSKLLLISFDAVGSKRLNELKNRPTFKKVFEGASVVTDVQSLFLTNTYPIHASVATGVTPENHGLVSNTEPFPKRYPKWCYQAKGLKARTLWQAAHEKGLKTAAVMWPVTAGAREINYNIPEILKLPGESQIALNLRYGTPLLSIRLFFKYRHLMRGIEQPYLDFFSTACMVDILNTRKPHLALMHLTAFDSLCHQYGTEAPELEKAMDALDNNLKALLEAAGDEYTVIIFSDHSQLDVSHVMLPNEGLGENGGFVECCGGSAFFHPGSGDVEAVREKLAQEEGFNRFLTREEMAVCGRAELPFGMAAKPGFVYEAFHSGEKANHGYPADYEDYSVFYLAKGPKFKSGLRLTGGSLLDITPLARKILELNMPNIQGNERF